MKKKKRLDEVKEKRYKRKSIKNYTLSFTIYINNVTVENLLINSVRLYDELYYKTSLRFVLYIYIFRKI